MPQGVYFNLFPIHSNFNMPRSLHAALPTGSGIGPIGWLELD